MKKKLGEIADYVNGRAFKPSEWEKNGLPIIRIQNLNDPTAAYNYSDKQHKEKYKVQNGDLLFAWSASLGAYIWKRGDAWLNQHIFRVDHNESINKKYLYYCLTDIVDELYAKSHGSGMVHVTKGKFEDTEIPVPPLPTQHRIVEKIEELFSELDNGVENLKKAQQQLKTYRQAVLKDAFEGKLTKEWRALRQAQDANRLPTPDELLQQIKAERNAHRQRELAEWEQEVEQWEKDGKPGRKPRKPRKNYKPLPIEEKMLDLPSSWLESRLCLLCSDITDGDHQAPPKADSGFPFITISNIDNNKIDFSDTFYVGQEYFDSLKKERKPQKGDVLYTVTGSFGIPVLVDFERQFCFKRHIGLLRSFNSVNQKWLYYLMQTPNVLQQAKKDATGTAQKTVSLTSLRQFIVPFISLEEQKEIVIEIESRLSVVDQLEQTIKENLQKAEALRQSILKKAFGGGL